MNQTTVGRVLGWLAKATGKDVACDRTDLVELMNDVRQLAYSNAQILQHAKPAYICVPVQCFCPACDPGYCGCSGQGPSWSGITLPPWMLQPTVIMKGGTALPYVTRWTSYSPVPGGWDNGWTFQDMGDSYVFEREPGCADPFELSVMGTKCRKGQVVTVTYVDGVTGKVGTGTIKLEAGHWNSLGVTISSVVPSGVRLPLDLEGPIKVRANGVDVAQWDPGVDVPAFRRIRLPGNCPCGGNQTLAVKGIRRFTRLWDDQDIVEHDNRMAWEAAAHFIRTVSQSKMDQAEIANSLFKRNLFDGFIASQAESEDTGHRRRLATAQTFNQPGRFGM